MLPIKLISIQGLGESSLKS